MCVRVCVNPLPEKLSRFHYFTTLFFSFYTFPFPATGGEIGPNAALWPLLTWVRKGKVKGIMILYYISS